MMLKNSIYFNNKSYFALLLVVFFSSTLAQQVGTTVKQQKQNTVLNTTNNVLKFSKEKSLEIDSILASAIVYTENIMKSKKVLEENYIKSENKLLPFQSLKDLEDADATLGNIKQYVSELTDSLAIVDSIKNTKKYIFNHHIVGEPMTDIVFMSLQNAASNIKYQLSYISQNKLSVTKKQQQLIKSILTNIEDTEKICKNIYNKFSNLYMARPELIQQHNNLGF